MTRELFRKQVSDFAAAGEPFIFVIDFECLKPFVCKLDEAADNGILYDIRGKSNVSNSFPACTIKLGYHPPDISIFSEKFDKIISHLNNGDTYLLNLTFPTRLETYLTTEKLFHHAKAPYKLMFKDEFIVFSPECFIRTKENYIYTYPMKGTIDAATENAAEVLLSDKKEEWEHNTIVDLMRNDLAIVSENIEITKYRYVEKIRTNKNEILQTSSEIRGKLKCGWQQDPGDMLMKLLPAGSVSGAPKQKTVEIIRETEGENRGYYTGVFGIFDGKDVESAVMIRYIEKRNDQLYFRSGGGITAESIMQNEYNELIQKIYVPSF